MAGMAFWRAATTKFRPVFVYLTGTRAAPVLCGLWLNAPCYAADEAVPRKRRSDACTLPG